MADSIGQISDFMAAIRRKESGGNYNARNPDSGAFGAFQFMPATWRNAARQAGLNPSDRSAHNQDAVARHLMTKYFKQTGSWRMVARFWYAGPGSVRYSQSALDRRQGGGKYPSINDYTASVIGFMGNPSTPGVEGGRPNRVRSSAGGSTRTQRPGWRGRGSQASTTYGTDGYQTQGEEFYDEGEEDMWEGADPSPPTEEEIVEMIREEYPEYAFLLEDPEMRAILVEAVDPYGGLDDAAFMARVRRTPWYQTHGETIRSWDALVETDPASAQRYLEKELIRLRALGARLGVQTSAEDLQALAERSLRFDLSDQEISNEFGNLMWDDDPDTRSGAMAATMTKMRAMAKDYLVSVDEPTLMMWARRVVIGQNPESDFQNALINMAKAKYSGNKQMTQMLDDGTTPSAFFSDHRNMIANEWDMTPDQVDLMDPKWSKVLQTEVDGVIRPMTLAEAQVHSRMTSGWDKTKLGTATAHQIGLRLLEKLGAVKL